MTRQRPRRIRKIKRFSSPPPESASPAAFAEKILAEPGAITAENFKALVNQVKTETGVKGAELFHPIRIMLTGTHSGPEFDKLIPLIEDGSRLPLPIHIHSVRERIALALRAYGPSQEL